jgi:RNA polymerase sigma-70 factor (ECF subfamily)
MTDSTRPPDERDRNDVTDTELAVAALQGSEAACESLVRRFERPVYNLVCRLVRDPAAAEDLTQDTFLKLFRALGTYDPRQRFSSWLFRIAHNTAIDHLRQRRLLPLEAPPGADVGDDALAVVLPDRTGVSPEQAAAQVELTEALDRAIDELRPEYRAAVVLRHQEDLDYGEIATVLGVPLGTVKTYLHRARREMASHLTRAGWRAPETVGRERP